MPGGRGTTYWWQYPFANDYGGKEPYGNNPKADINVQVPPGTGIGNITPGTITNIDTSSPWGYAITIKLDNPQNSLATHAAYLHMGSIAPGLHVGQHVDMFDNLGSAGPPSRGNFQNAPLGFAFYPGDKYGYGPEWNSYFQYKSTPALNPYPFLSKFSNQSPEQITQLASNSSTPSNICDTPVVGGLVCFIQNNLATWALTVGFFLLGLVLIILGFVILVHPNPETLLKGATLAA